MGLRKTLNDDEVPDVGNLCKKLSYSLFCKAHCQVKVILNGRKFKAC